jgi:hypothetical protein
MKDDLMLRHPVKKFTDVELAFCKSIAEKVCVSFGVTYEDIGRRCRIKPIVFARAVYYHILRQRTKFSMVKIGQSLYPIHESSDKEYYTREEIETGVIFDHATVLNGLRNIYKLIDLCIIAKSYKDGQRKVQLMNDILDNTSMLVKPTFAIRIGVRCRALDMNGIVTRVYKDDRLRVLFEDEVEADLGVENVDVFA